MMVSRTVARHNIREGSLDIQSTKETLEGSGKINFTSISECAKKKIGYQISIFLDTWISLTRGRTLYILPSPCMPSTCMCQWCICSVPVVRRLCTVVYIHVGVSVIYLVNIREVMSLDAESRPGGCGRSIRTARQGRDMNC